MEMKRYRRFRMDFGSIWLNTHCILCGFAFFLRIAYYFMFVNPTLCPTSEVIFSMILPLLLCGASMVVLKYFKLNAPGTVAIIDALKCICLLIGTFFGGSVIQIILGVILYLAAAVLLIGTVGGYVPTRQFVVILFFLIFVLRILFFRPGFSLLGWILELSDLSMLASLIVVTFGMTPVQRKMK